MVIFDKRPAYCLLKLLKMRWRRPLRGEGRSREIYRCTPQVKRFDWNTMNKFYLFFDCIFFYCECKYWIFIGFNRAKRIMALYKGHPDAAWKGGLPVSTVDRGFFTTSINRWPFIGPTFIHYHSCQILLPHCSIIKKSQLPKCLYTNIKLMKFLFLNLFLLKINA